MYPQYNKVNAGKPASPGSAPFKVPEFEVGQVVVATGPYGESVTEGKTSTAHTHRFRVLTPGERVQQELFPED
jgi:hypothetical protein